MVHLNWGGPGYATYEGFLKVSSGEKKAAGQQQAVTSALQNESKSLLSMANTQFQEQQSLLNNTLIPQLTQMATNPQGFGATAIAAMRSQAIGTIGTQTASQLQKAQEQFSTQNMAGLQSGVQQALKGQIGLSATGEEAGALQNISIADAQAKMQQQEFGLSGLAGATSLLGQAPQAAGLSVSALEGAGSSAAQSFQQQYTMAQQGGFWSNLATGAIGALAGGLTGGPIGAIMGGVKGLATGIGFGGGMQNAMSAGVPYAESITNVA